MRPAVLYISYDGMLEPLGQSQVLAYLERLARDWPIHLLSFEKPLDKQNTARMALVQKQSSEAGIKWVPLTYHKSPSAPATAYDIAVGTAVATAIARRHGVRIVHARSYVPALIALSVKKLTGAKFLFDMRGFWADERIDGGLWPKEGWLYRTTKQLERTFFREADHIVTLTHASKRHIQEFDFLKNKTTPISVIPTCADLNVFKPQERRHDPIFVLGYVGSAGTWYLFDVFLRFFEALKRRHPAKLLIVNRNEHDFILSALADLYLSENDYDLISCEHRDVAHHIRRMDAGAALCKPCYSKIASAPTKLAEYLGCGVPCVGNEGVGDVKEILEENRVGVVLTDFSQFGIEAGADRLLALSSDPDTPRRCVETARRLFSLDVGVESYNNIYESLAG